MRALERSRTQFRWSDGSTTVVWIYDEGLGCDRYGDHVLDTAIKEVVH